MSEIKFTDGRDASGVVIENQITEVKLSYHHNEWKIEVTKEFSPQYGGGSQVFTLSGGPQIHEALRRAAEMVTLTPTYNGQPEHFPESEYCALCKRSLDRETEVFVEDGGHLLHQHCAHELWEASDENS